MRWLALLLASALAIAACGDDDGGDLEGALEEDTTEDTKAPSEDDEPSGDAISSVDDAEQAVVQIVATGSFVDPEIGLQLNAAGAGSGFIIDPEGIVVTNNHVVTGAATIEVYIGGEDDPVNARVLGVSECADLAVIDLEGDGYPYFEWYDDEVDVNLDVRAAGFPLGDPEYTLTRGIVSKAETGGETVWASVDQVIEHDAKINPGNSGGPLLSEDGRVVGVNYAGVSETDQNYAIGADLAEGIVEDLQSGESVQSLGINGQAIYDEASGITGVWVASVESGSPADDSGIQAGDIVTRLENIVIATDGTMKEYCDVLQTKGTDAVLKVEVLRYASEEVLEGEINGDPLVQSFSFAQELEDEVASDDGGGGGVGGTYSSYSTLTDDTGALSVEVPAEWSDVDPVPTDNGDPYIAAAPDLQGYLETWDVPGMTFVALSSPDYVGQTDEALLDQFRYEGCTSEGFQPYEDALYTGTYDFTTNCGGTATSYVTVIARPADNAFVAVVGVQIVSDADLDALDQILNTFVVQV